jgi:hypothetical protein
MVDWLAGNRVRGTSAERTTSAGFNDVVSISGGWKELARTTLGSAGTSISVASLPDKRYYKILYDGKTITSAYEHAIRLNNDSGSNYAIRRENNGGTDATLTSQTSMPLITTSSGSDFGVGYISNLSSKEKLCIFDEVEERTGVANAPFRQNTVGKWANTSNAIDRIDIIRSAGAGSIDTGSELVILGWDPADTHTTNFWEELASVSGDGSSTTLSSGTITAKKYLWTQLYSDATSNAVMRFNSDTGTNYARRGSVNGASDFTVTSATGLSNLPSSNEAFGNAFIINNASNEKLVISNAIDQNTAGAGNAPTRKEEVDKWTNTSSQITNISWTKTGNWSSNAILKVWGSD